MIAATGDIAGVAEAVYRAAIIEGCGRQTIMSNQESDPERVAALVTASRDPLLSAALPLLDVHDLGRLSCATRFFRYLVQGYVSGTANLAFYCAHSCA